MRNTIICLFALFLLRQPATAQTIAGQPVYTAKEIKMHTSQPQRLVNFFTRNGKNVFLASRLLPPSPKPVAKPTILPLAPLSTSSESFSVLPNNFYCSGLGWVCQKEWQLEKKTKIPFRLRLGSKEQVDWLEGKTLH